MRASVSSASGFLAIVVKRAIAKVRHVVIAEEHRDASAAARAMTAGMLAIVDAELVRDPALRRALVARRAPTIVIDGRGEGVPEDVVANPAVIVVRGRRAGELDLEAIESGLGPAIARALRGFVSAAVKTEPIEANVEPYEGALDLVVLGVSTGGPTLLLELLPALDTPTIPMLTVQHMPESETLGFAARLAEESGHAVVEVGVGPIPPAGTIGVVRGGSDVRVVRRAEGKLALREAIVPDNPYHPSVDEVLRSAVAADVMVGAAVLTGMGNDGAAGATALARKGLPVIAQRPDTCAVAGMPQAVIDAGAARWVQPPTQIARTINRWFADAATKRGAS